MAVFKKFAFFIRFCRVVCILLSSLFLLLLLLLAKLILRQNYLLLLSDNVNLYAYEGYQYFEHIILAYALCPQTSVSLSG